MMRDSRRAVHRAELLARVRGVCSRPAVCIKCGKCLYVVPRRAFRSMRMRVRAPSFFFSLVSFYLIHALSIGTGEVSPRFAIKRNYPRLSRTPSATLDKIAVISSPMRHTGYLGIINMHFHDGGIVPLDKN